MENSDSGVLNDFVNETAKLRLLSGVGAITTNQSMRWRAARNGADYEYPKLHIFPASLCCHDALCMLSPGSSVRY